MFSNHETLVLLLDPSFHFLSCIDQESRSEGYSFKIVKCLFNLYFAFTYSRGENLKEWTEIER